MNDSQNFGIVFNNEQDLELFLEKRLSETDLKGVMTSFLINDLEYINWQITGESLVKLGFSEWASGMEGDCKLTNRGRLFIEKFVTKLLNSSKEDIFKNA